MILRDNLDLSAPFSRLTFVGFAAMDEKGANSVLTMQGRDKSPIGVVRFT